MDVHSASGRRHPGSVIASDVRMNRDLLDAGPFVYCDVQDKVLLHALHDRVVSPHWARFAT